MRACVRARRCQCRALCAQAHGEGPAYAARVRKLLAENSRVFFAGYIIGRWLAIRLDTLSTALMGLVALFGVSACVPAFVRARALQLPQADAPAPGDNGAPAERLDGGPCAGVLADGHR